MAHVAVLTVIAAELDAARAALGATDADRIPQADGTVYFRGRVHSELHQGPYEVVLGCIGSAGNPSAAAAAQAILERFRPKALLLVGIAAGVRDKVRIGDVVLSDRVVAYEPAAVVRTAQGEPGQQARPEIDRTPHAMNQAVVSYHADRERLQALFERIGGHFPKPPDDKKKDDYRRHVASALHVQVGTIASGEKLLRDPKVLLTLREHTHGKIEAGEMEAAGVVEACRRSNVPWLVVRGISDFGDELKDDSFHKLAACTAATVMADFLAHGLALATAKGPRPVERERRRFFFGRPVDSDQDFVGRDEERGLILGAIEQGQPVQILGERLMGKSSLLRWAGRHAPPERPVVSIDASQALSPATLVMAISGALGQEPAAKRLQKPKAGAAEAAEVLKQLRPAVLLFDDADFLAQRGQGFDEDFFEVVRSLVEARRLTWVSASHRNLYDLFKGRGLTSRFLNSSRKIWVGSLAAGAAQELASRCDGGHSEAMLAEAGGFAHGLQWLGDRLSSGSRGGFDGACDDFRNEMQSGVFARWWEGLNAEERQELKACAAGGMALLGLEERMRRRLRALCHKGLLKEEGGAFFVEGASWHSFVRNDT